MAVNIAVNSLRFLFAVNVDYIRLFEAVFIPVAGDGESFFFTVRVVVVIIKIKQLFRGVVFNGFSELDRKSVV